MVANGSTGVWEHGSGEEYSGNKSVENKEVKIPTLGSTPAPSLPSLAPSLCPRRHPGKACKLMKCENTCGRCDYGLSEIQLHKLMIKPMSLRRWA